MGERYYRQTDEFVVVDDVTGDAETVFEFTEFERVPDERRDAPHGKIYNLRRGAQRIVRNDDGSFSAPDGARRYTRA